MIQKLGGRVALVTGASRGIGRAVALELAWAGAHVIALARTQGALEALDDQIRLAGGSATLVPCDLKDFEALDRLRAAVEQRWGRLDILFGNAGVLGPLSALNHLEPDEWDHVMAVNVTANWRLIRSFDALLRASDAGRALFTTSGVAHRATMRAYWGLYATSKAALETLVRTYAAETENTGIKVMLVQPGALRTRMRANAMPGEDPLTLKTPEDLAPKVAAMCAADWNRSGLVYDFPSDRVLGYQGMAEV